jgi:DNA replication terminus site-binding protein
MIPFARSSWSCTLRQALHLSTAGGRVFELPAISKDAEHDPLANITVVQHTGKAALDLALTLWPSVYPAAIGNRSSKAAVRLPGAICLQVTAAAAGAAGAHSAYQTLKATFEKIVTVDSGLAPTARLSGCIAICLD